MLHPSGIKPSATVLQGGPESPRRGSISTPVLLMCREKASRSRLSLAREERVRREQAQSSRGKGGRKGGRGGEMVGGWGGGSEGRGGKGMTGRGRRKTQGLYHLHTYVHAHSSEMWLLFLLWRPNKPVLFWWWLKKESV